MASCIRRVVAMVANLWCISRGLVDPGVSVPGRVDTGLDDVVEVDPVLVRGSTGGLAPVGRSSLKAVPVVAVNSELPGGTVMACPRECRGSSMIASSFHAGLDETPFRSRV